MGGPMLKPDTPTWLTIQTGTSKVRPLLSYSPTETTSISLVGWCVGEL